MEHSAVASRRAGARPVAGELVVDEIGHHELQVEAWTDRFDDVATRRRDQGIGERSRARNGPRGRRAVARPAREAGREAVEAIGHGGREGIARHVVVTVDERLTAGLDEHVASLVSAVPDPIDLTRTKSCRSGSIVPVRVSARGTRCSLAAKAASTRRTKRLPDIAAMGFDVVYLPPIHPIGHTFRKGRNNTVGAGPDDPGSPWAIGSDGRRPHSRSHPSSARSTTSTRSSSRARRTRPRSRARLRAAVLARPSLGARASRVVPPAARRFDRVRREPAEEVPGHLPDQLLAREGRGPQSAVGRRARRSSTSGSTTACASSASTTRTPSRSRSGTGSSTTVQRRASRRRLPRRGVHATDGDVASSRRSGSRRATRTSRGATASGSSRTTSSELAHGPTSPTASGPNFWPNTPDILAGPLRNGPPAAFRLRLAARGDDGAELRHLLRLRAVRERAGVGRQRGVPALGEVRDQGAATGTGETRWRRSSHSVNDVRQRHDALRRVAHDRCSTTSTTTTSSPTRSGRETAAMSSCVW